MFLVELICEYSYICGVLLILLGYSFYGKIMLKLGIDCLFFLELIYYFLFLGFIDLCYYCGIDGVLFDVLLK